MRQKRTKIVTPVTLREVYAHPGDYTVKLMIDPRVSQDIGDVQVSMRNGDGRPMEFSSKRWGTKLTVGFTIDELTPDGVSVIDVSLFGPWDRPQVERFYLWVIK